MSKETFPPQERWYNSDGLPHCGGYESEAQARAHSLGCVPVRAYVVPAEQWEAMVAERCAECGHAARGEILNGIYACQYCVLVESKNLCDEIINSKQADLTAARARIAELESRPMPDWAYSVICAVRTYMHCNVGDMNTYEKALRHAARQIPDNFEKATTPDWALRLVKACCALHFRLPMDLSELNEFTAALAAVPEDVLRQAKETGI